MQAPPNGVVARAFHLLACFDERHVRMTLSELARRSGLPVNTTLRIARSLVAEGALERGDDGRFTPGLHLYELATLAPRGVGLREAATPALRDLHALTGHHALLTVREEGEAVLVERVSPRGGARQVEYRVGGRMPLAATGGGLVLLAFGPRDVQERAIIAFNARHAIDGIGTPEDLRRMLSEIRLTGSMVGSRSRPRPRVTAAVPIRDADGGVVAALSVVLPQGVMDPAALVPALFACSRATTRDLARGAP